MFGEPSLIQHSIEGGAAWLSEDEMTGDFEVCFSNGDSYPVVFDLEDEENPMEMTPREQAELIHEYYLAEMEDYEQRDFENSLKQSYFGRYAH